MLQRGGGRFDPAFGCDFQSAFERQLNFPRCLFPSFAVRHYAGPFDDLGDETFVPFLCRVPDPNFVVARVFQRMKEEG